MKSIGGIFMKGLKWTSALTSIIGIIFIIYGWTQSGDFGASSSEFETILLKRTIRSYVFTIGGLIFITIGISLQLVKGYLYELENKFYESKYNK